MNGEYILSKTKSYLVPKDTDKLHPIHKEREVMYEICNVCN